jgi:hypothetical protein
VAAIKMLDWLGARNGGNDHLLSQLCTAYHVTGVSCDETEMDITRNVVIQKVAAAMNVRKREHQP